MNPFFSSNGPAGGGITTYLVIGLMGVIPCEKVRFQVSIEKVAERTEVDVRNRVVASVKEYLYQVAFVDRHCYPAIPPADFFGVTSKARPVGVCDVSEML